MPYIIAERRERSEANNRVLFEIPRYLYSGFEVTCPDRDLQSALDHAARDKWVS